MVDIEKEKVLKEQEHLTEDVIKNSEINYSIAVHNLVGEINDAIWDTGEYPDWDELNVSDENVIGLVRKLLSETFLKTAPKEDYTTAERKKRLNFAKKIMEIVHNSPYYEDIISIINETKDKKESFDDPTRASALVDAYKEDISFFEDYMEPITEGHTRGNK